MIWAYTLMCCFLAAVLVPATAVWMQNRHQAAQYQQLHQCRSARPRLSLVLGRRAAGHCFLKGGREMWYEGVLYDVLSVRLLDADHYWIEAEPDHKETRLYRLCFIDKTPFSLAGHRSALFHFLCTRPGTFLLNLCAPPPVHTHTRFAVCGRMLQGFRKIFAPPPEAVHSV